MLYIKIELQKGSILEQSSFANDLSMLVGTLMHHEEESVELCFTMP
jgi:hypothetical protein